MSSQVVLPNNWDPRYYQAPLWDYLQNGGLRAYEVAHRRWGKDDVCLHWTSCAANCLRIGNYWHLLPEASQARKAIWDAINPHTGKKRIDEAFPYEIRKRTVDHEMKIEFRNGSLWQVLGSDNYNSFVGSPPIGVVLSEWALADPQAWAYIMPILEENGGWALFITTARGRNHAHRFLKMARESEGWYADISTAENTDVFSPEQLERIRKELIAQYGEDEGEAKYQQEYFCSFDAALPGAYYGKEMNKAEKEGRITGVPYKPGVPVFPIFDFGRGLSNSTAVWFMQIVGREPRAIDYEESSSGDIDTFGMMLKEKGYQYGKLILPHDGGDARLATGMSYESQFRAMGYETLVLPKPESITAHITLTRSLINQTVFDEKNCERGIDCLRSYHREWDDENKTFKAVPKHDWASHGADAFRYAAQAHENGLLQLTPKPGKLPSMRVQGHSYMGA